MKRRNLKIQGVHGVIDCTLLEAQGEARSLALLFPGAGYTCDCPLFYYFSELLLERGHAVLLVERNYSKLPEWLSLEEKKRWDWALDEAEVVARFVKDELLEFSSYTLVGKSLGSYALTRVLKSGLAPIQKIFWLTPSLRNDWAIMRDCAIPSFAVIGTKDPRYEVGKAFFPENTLVIEGADHAMEVGETSENIRVMGQIMSQCAEWLD